MTSVAFIQKKFAKSVLQKRGNLHEKEHQKISGTSDSLALAAGCSTLIPPRNAFSSFFKFLAMLPRKELYILE